MKEYKLKFLDIDVPKITKLLEQRGAVKTFDGTVTDRHYDLPNRKLSEEGHNLKLSQFPKGIAGITLKKIIDKNTFRFVHEKTDMYPTLEEAEEALREMKLLEIYSFKKHRISYQLRYSHVDIDKLEDGIPAYLEISAPVTEEIEILAKEFGLGMKDGKSWGVNEIRKHYGKDMIITVIPTDKLIETAEQFMKRKSKPSEKEISMKDIGRKGKYIFKVESRTFMQQHNLIEKVFVVERLRRVRSEGKTSHDKLKNGEIEYRIGYYMIGKNGNKKGKWTWGQYCPMIPQEDFWKLITKAKDEGTII